ncbi:MAG: malto-oligosyltrehalose synthase, partial [Pseudomonadota bacterium]|nr:malto-oligosyltrehalose synthase [Pseudomonadota bacterium]
FAQRLQQYTAPVVAKGIEDTALYRHQRLISLNDVGGEPDDFGISVAAFHAINKERQAERPAAMLATSTHDAKRSEDVRLRIDVISEMPAAWRLTARRWSRLARSHKHTVDGERAPSRNDEYLIYQTLIGSLPVGELDEGALADYMSRVQAAMLKSSRESKLITSWMNPNPAYEKALEEFITALLTRRESNLFLPDLQATVALIAWYGALNGLSLAVLKGLSPGVPDYYQGHEAIELSLVDPDNRRAVDYTRRRAMLHQAQAHGSPGVDADLRKRQLHEWLTAAPDGRAKFWVSWSALQLRARHGPMLERAEYVPLEITGPRAEHVVAFARRDGATWLVSVATRLPAMLGLAVGEPPVGDVWLGTEIVWPGSDADPLSRPIEFIDAISGRNVDSSGRVLSLSEVLREFPVALLESS